MVNSKCVNYVLASFRPNGYTTIANLVNTSISPCAAGHTGSYQATRDNQIAAGLPYTFHSRILFIRIGPRFGFEVDETPFETPNNQEMYIDNLRYWRNYMPGVE